VSTATDLTRLYEDMRQKRDYATLMAAWNASGQPAHLIVEHAQRQGRAVIEADIAEAVYRQAVEDHIRKDLSTLPDLGSAPGA
jgi:hypothetical protein